MFYHQSHDIENRLFSSSHIFNR